MAVGAYIRLDFAQFMRNSFVISLDAHAYSRFCSRMRAAGFDTLPRPVSAHDPAVVRCRKTQESTIVSHYQIINMALTLDLPYVMIFEDDAYPAKDCCARMRRILEDGLPEDADMVSFGNLHWVHADRVHRYAQLRDIDKSGRFGKLCGVLYGSHAVLVFRSAYTKWLSLYGRDPTVMSDHFHCVTPGFYAVTHSLFVQAHSAIDYTDYLNDPDNFDAEFAPVSDTADADGSFESFLSDLHFDPPSQSAFTVDDIMAESFVVARDHDEYNMFCSRLTDAGFRAMPALCISEDDDSDIKAYCSIVKNAKDRNLSHVTLFRGDALPAIDCRRKLSRSLRNGIPSDAGLLVLGNTNWVHASAAANRREIPGFATELYDFTADGMFGRIRTDLSGGHAFTVFGRSYDEWLHGIRTPGCSVWNYSQLAFSRYATSFSFFLRATDVIVGWYADSACIKDEFPDPLAYRGLNHRTTQEEHTR